MGTPWTHSAKSVDLSGHTDQAHSLFPTPGFVPAPLRGTISFSPSMLYAALAKTTALGSAGTALMGALTHSDQALIEAIVDENGGDFLFTQDIAHLGADLRKALAGRIGAALCHLYMDQLGYAWVDYANGYIPTRAPLGDFLYDGAGLGSPGLALSEAKGSLRATASASQVKAIADAAYQRQVSPHLGAVTSAGRIEYGCAVATAILPAQAWLPGAPSCFLHVTQTAPALAPPTAGTAPLAGEEESIDRVPVSCLIALRNYRAVFRLIAAPFMVDFLERLIGGQSLDIKLEQRFGYLTTELHEDGEWVVGDSHNHPSAKGYHRANELVDGTEFALHRGSFEAVMDVVMRCARDRELLTRQVLLPNLALTHLSFGDDPGGPLRALLGDGLAVVSNCGRHFPDAENFRWPG